MSYIVLTWLHMLVCADLKLHLYFKDVFLRSLLRYLAKEKCIFCDGFHDRL